MSTQPAKPSRKVVSLEASVLEQLANNAQVVSEFPFFASLKNHPEATECGGCGGGTTPNVNREVVIATIKQSVLGMADTQRNRLKAILSTEKLRITYRQGNQIVTQVI